MTTLEPRVIQPPPVPTGGNRFYQEFDIEEDTERTAFHYEQDPEFYTTMTGGEWNVYSSLLWEDHFTDVTQAQTCKLDKFAELMELKPGMHIMDVGCGWGGPLVYLCHKYGVTGTGITIVPEQLPTARARAAKYGVNAQFIECHWKNLPEVETYDAIFSDEVIVHFYDLGGFFARCHKILTPGGRMAHKELHLAHSSYSKLGPASEFVHKMFGYTGNYLTLFQELQLLDENGFKLRQVFDMPMTNYHRTLDAWLQNMFENRERLKEVTTPDFYANFRAMLKACRLIFTRTDYMGMHIVATTKMD
ncbi:MAG: class I SAM-dependent methyltransferase [Chloroflexi bacterium]|nr:class I SAM-dependent methyltransferase [Chloroflexota bacterium]MCI0574789.1 class I SAM-dependent methyltransferase [Chloroflexota bacterium]MCI0649810.1 class I SAM-dependent methyltransferase [Chloroflexota bacterium]MCI0731053.1 class I SAM-dependent methyltransferase [Chloroflexota bacterium]